MIQGMRAEGETLPAHLRDLRRAQHRLGDIADGHLPVVLAAHAAGHHEHGGRKAVLDQRGKRRAVQTAVAIVERDHHRLGREFGGEDFAGGGGL